MGSDQMGENTRAVHLPPAPVPAQQPLGTPVYRTAAFAFSSSAEYAALLNGEAEGDSYSRIDNPTADAFAIAVAALEGQHLPRAGLNAGPAAPVAAQAFASGMAAISSVFWTFTAAGGHVVAPAAVYGGTYGFLRHVAARFGVQADFVDVTDSGPGAGGAAAGDQDRVRRDAGQPDDGRGRPARPGRDRASARRAAGGGLHHGPAGIAGRWSTARTWRCTRPPSTWAATRTRPTGGVGGARPDRPGPRGPHRHRRPLAPDEAFLLRRGLETLPLRSPRVLDRDAVRRRGGPSPAVAA